jgi:ATP-dependent Clp protease protease subunit
MAIYDTMHYIRVPGLHDLRGAGGVDGRGVAGGGAAGKRRRCPHSRVLIHQPLGGCAARPPTSRSTPRDLRWKTRSTTCHRASTPGSRSSASPRDTERDNIMTAVRGPRVRAVDEVLSIDRE